MDIVVRRARAIVTQAIDRGWSGPPFDPSELARQLGIHVVGRDDVHDARTIADEADRLRIEFNPSRPGPRIRYSIAHEIAHSLFPDCAEHVRNRAAYHELVRDEWQLEALCNIAAAEFVMPVGSFKELEAEESSIDQLLKERTRFEVSMEALLIRVAHLSARPIAMFCASRIEFAPSRGRYRLDYSIKSPSWSLDLPRGLALPRQSKVAEVSAIGYTAKGLERWGNDEVYLECVGIPPYPGSTWPRVVGLAQAESGPHRADSGISYLRGDALEPRGDGPALIAHVVNDATPNWGGGGFAQSVRRRLPMVQADFKTWASIRGNLRLGNVHLSRAGDDLYLYSMVCQEGYGPSAQPRLRYAALQGALQQLADAAIRLTASIHMPRIGTGHAGGSWEIVEELVRQELCDRGLNVTVYDLPDPGGRPSRAAAI